MKIAKVYVPSIALFAVLAACLLAADGIIVRGFVPDLLFVSDSIWRSHLGQVPHTDFISPIGQAFYWPYSLVSLFSGGSILDILRANVLVAAFALLLCLFCFPSRLSPAPIFLATGLVLLGALTGRSVDLGAEVYDYLAPYNRWGWSFAMIATVIATLPRRVDSKTGDRVDEICLALCLAVLFFLKMSFFLVVLGVVMGAAILQTFSLKSIGLAIVYLLGLIVAVEVLFNNVGGYLSDLRLAGLVYADEGQNGRVPRIVAAAVMGGVVFGLALVMIRLAAKPTNMKGWFGYWWREFALAALIIGGAAAIKSQNHPRWEMAMLSLALLIVAVRVTRRRQEVLSSDQEQSSNIKLTTHRFWSVTSALVVGVTLVPHLASDSLSIVYHLVETRKAADCSRPEFRGTPMAPLLFPKPGLLSAPSGDGACADIFARAPGELPQSAEAEYRRLLRTTGVLREHVQPHDVILALEFANPYSFIFRTAPPRGALIFWDRGRTFSYNIHPEGASLLQDVTFAVETNYPTQVEALVPSRIEMWTRLRQALRPIYDDGTGTGQDMWFVYGRAVQEAFMPVGTAGEDVTVWKRRN